MKYYLMTLNGTTVPGLAVSDVLPEGAVECTEDQYQAPLSWAIVNGSLTAVTPPAIPLADQASMKLVSQKTYIMEEYLVYGLAVPDDWATYMQALKAIASGTDTTSTTLPLSPTEQATQELTPAQKVKKALLALGAMLEEKQALGIYYTPAGGTMPILFSTSAHAQDQYNGANTLAKENPTQTQNFITEAGAPVTLSASDVIAVTNKAANYINQTNAVYSALFAKVEADPATDITVGWPANT